MSPMASLSNQFYQIELKLLKIFLILGLESNFFHTNTVKNYKQLFKLKKFCSSPATPSLVDLQSYEEFIKLLEERLTKRTGWKAREREPFYVHSDDEEEEEEITQLLEENKKKNENSSNSNHISIHLKYEHEILDLLLADDSAEEAKYYDLDLKYPLGEKVRPRKREMRLLAAKLNEIWTEIKNLIEENDKEIEKENPKHKKTLEEISFSHSNENNQEKKKKKKRSKKYSLDNFMIENTKEMIKIVKIWKEKYEKK